MNIQIMVDCCILDEELFKFLSKLEVTPGSSEGQSSIWLRNLRQVYKKELSRQKILTCDGND